MKISSIVCVVLSIWKIFSFLSTIYFINNFFLHQLSVFSDLEWSEWGEWGHCSKSCWRTRTRTCIKSAEDASRDCEGNKTETEICSGGDCGKWVLHFVFVKKLISIPFIWWWRVVSVTDEQLLLDCFSAGEWSKWQSWSLCTKSCKMTRRRTCILPYQRATWAKCKGEKKMETKNCYSGECGEWFLRFQFPQIWFSTVQMDLIPSLFRQGYDRLNRSKVASIALPVCCFKTQWHGLCWFSQLERLTTALVNFTGLRLKIR